MGDPLSSFFDQKATLSILHIFIKIMDNLKKPKNDRLKEEFLSTPVSEYASNQISDTEDEILSIEAQIKDSKDEKERKDLEFILDFLKEKLVIENNYREKVADVDQSFNELAKNINKPKNGIFNFQNILYGESGGELTKSRVVGTNILLIFLVASIYGMWADFIPNDNIISSGKSLSIVSAVLISILFSWSVFTGRWKTKIHNKIYQALLSITFIPILFFSLSWLTFSYGMPALYTRIAGNDIQIITDMKKDKNSSRRSCDYQLKGDIMRTAFPNYLCISKEYYLKEPNIVSVRLTGKESYFGKYVIHIYDNSDK